MTDTGRLLACTRCRDKVRVHEIPRPFIDPDLYVCGECAQPKPVPQLALEERTETKDYDPSIAAFPEGF